MNFLIVTHVVHKKKDNAFYAYEPYIREMNLWIQNVDYVKIIAPTKEDNISKIDASYHHNNLGLESVPRFNLLSIKNKLKSIAVFPYIFYKTIKGMIWADHIHIRCPGNIGLIGCFIQVLFPNTPKTVKYAGNWDPNSKQPWSYKLQKWILSNTFLTRNCKVLVYGEWKNQSKNIIPFFTASYSESEIEELPKKELTDKIKLIFVGTFSKGKQPLQSVKVAEILLKRGFNVELRMFGEGEEFKNVKKYIKDKNLEKVVFLYGNQSKETVKKAFQESHFLVFISKSEGWPKVVAEAMFWECLPLSTRVSCVPSMFNEGKRGELVSNNVHEIVERIEYYIKNENENEFEKVTTNAKIWAQNYTLEYFQESIRNLI